MSGRYITHSTEVPESINMYNYYPLLTSKDIIHHYQSGNGVFQGIYHPRIRGRGLGGILASISRLALPVLKKVIMPSAGRAVMNVASDIISGQNVRTALKRRAGEAGKGIINAAIGQVTNPTAKKAKRLAKRPSQLNRRKRKYRDIFT